MPPHAPTDRKKKEVLEPPLKRKESEVTEHIRGVVIVGVMRGGNTAKSEEGGGPGSVGGITTEQNTCSDLILTKNEAAPAPFWVDGAKELNVIRLPDTRDEVPVAKIPPAPIEGFSVAQIPNCRVVNSRDCITSIGRETDDPNGNPLSVLRAPRLHIIELAVRTDAFRVSNVGLSARGEPISASSGHPEFR